MKFGNTEIHIISDGNFKLDGGAMFGVVPKALWSRLEPADEENRILMGLNCLLIVRDDRKILIDTGIGDKHDAKFRQIYAVHKEKSLIENLQEKGFAPDDITDVIMTHMHFDHTGWNTRKAENGELAPTFPNAVYLAQRGEYETAKNPDPRSRASYLAENWQPLETSGQLELLYGSCEVLPGIESMITGGHTEFHTFIKLTTSEGIVAFLADLVPTPSHLKTPYVMGYDLFPVQTMEVKPKVLRQACDENWLLVFEHSARVKSGYLKEDNGKYVVKEVRL
jgi:glyoxylase-like metal-dependent hydrolase (beta-lactamase superfamily II)